MDVNDFLKKIFSLQDYKIDRKLLCFLGIKLTFKTRPSYPKYKNLPIEENKIVFSNFKGAGYGCNPKYIAEEIIKRNLSYDLVWLVNSIENNIDKFPKQIRLVNNKSKEAIRELATAKIWIDNQRKLYHIRHNLGKRHEQAYIQTWHGSLGIKKVGVDSPLTLNQKWVPFGKLDAKMLNYSISNSIFETNVFKSNFWGFGETLEYGHARNDIFFKSSEEKEIIKQKVCKDLNIPNNKKILLYIPSFRDNKKLDCYGIKSLEVLENIKKKFGDDWIFVVRLHPNIKKESENLFKFGNDIVDASFYPDIQELLVAGDIAITDYSSCVFDFMLSHKPAFIFATDIEKFNTDRGFYYPLETTPFPVARNNEELMNNILNFDNEKYQKDVDTFLQEKGCIEDGHASERVVDLIEEIMNAKKLTTSNF